MSFAAEAQIARELMKFARQWHIVPRVQAGDVVGGREDPRSPRPRVGIRGLHQRHDLGEVSGRLSRFGGRFAELEKSL